MKWFHVAIAVAGFAAGYVDWLVFSGALDKARHTCGGEIAHWDWADPDYMATYDYFFTPEWELIANMDRTGDRQLHIYRRRAVPMVWPRR